MIWVNSLQGMLSRLLIRRFDLSASCPNAFRKGHGVKRGIVTNDAHGPTVSEIAPGAVFRDPILDAEGGRGRSQLPSGSIEKFFYSTRPTVPLETVVRPVRS